MNQILVVEYAIFINCLSPLNLMEFVGQIFEWMDFLEEMSPADSFTNEIDKGKDCSPSEIVQNGASEEEFWEQH